MEPAETEVQQLRSGYTQRTTAPGLQNGTPSTLTAKVSGRPRRGRRRPQITRLELNTKQRVGFYLMVGLLHLVSLMPDCLLYPLGICGGFIGYLVDRRHLKIGMCNLAIAFPERRLEERRRILRASYINLGRSAAEYVRLGGFFYRRLIKRVTYQRFELWDQIRRLHPAKGALVLGAHLGNFELMATAHALHGHQISLVHHTQRFLAGDALVSFVRERAGVTILRKHAAARSVLTGLRQGQLIGVPFDQNAKRSEAVFVPFFTEIAATASGLARVVALTGAPVIPAFIIRQPNKRSHRIEIFEEIPIQRSADSAADIEVNTRRFVKAVEDAVRRNPEQFLWTHRRYRTRPVRGTPSFYQD